MAKTFRRGRLWTTTVLAGLVSTTQLVNGQAVQLTGDLTQRFELTSRSGTDDDGSVLESKSGLGLHFLSQTPTRKFTIDTGASLSFDSEGETSINRPVLSLGLSTETKRIAYSANLSYARAPLEFDETQPDLSTLTLDADKTTVKAQVGASIALTPTATGSISLSYAHIDFDLDSTELVESDEYALSGKLAYDLNSRTSFGLSTGLRLFSAQNAKETETRGVDFGASVSHQATSRLSFSGNVGLSLLDTTETTGGLRSSQTSTVGLFGVGLGYELPRGSLQVSADRSISAGGSGELKADTAVRLALKQSINSYGSYSLSTAYIREEDLDGGDSGNLLSISPAVNWEFTPKLSGGALYQFQRNDDGETSHKVGIFLKRGFDFTGG